MEIRRQRLRSIARSTGMQMDRASARRPTGRRIVDELPERLLAIRRALENVTSKDFWEIIDRGRNFDYMPPGQRERLPEFFGWLNVGKG